MLQNKSKQKSGFPFWAAGLALGITLLIVGAFEGQLADIYRKAVMICLECIGVG